MLKAHENTLWTKTQANSFKWLRNMLGQPCLETEKKDFAHQNCLEWEKSMGIHSGDIKKTP